MSQISFPGKPRKDGSAGFFTDETGSRIFIGRDYALQNQIDEVKAKSRERSCFKECQTCGCCANSRRGCASPRSYDANAAKTIDCRGCESFRFHDCHNGLMRNSRQEAEPFTQDQTALLKLHGGKPLID